MENAMRHLLMAALVGLGFVLSSAPVSATDQAGAIKLCAANPQCGLVRAQGGVNLWVGNNEVWCPDKGECECITCTGVPARRAGGPLGFILKRFMIPESVVSGGNGGGSVPSQHAPAPAPAPQQPPIL